MIMSRDTLWKAFTLMVSAKSMTEVYEENFKLVSKYVHATSRGHEAVQIALGLSLKSFDFVYPYYRDDAMLLAMGLSPYELMLQLLAKKDDPFSGGRTYYSHPSLNRIDFPKIPHQSSATGMQAIPATGAALGLRYKDLHGLTEPGQSPVVVCSLGDASITEGEVAEAFFMASLKKLPIIYLVQDNEWDISAHASEFRGNNDASQFIKGFPNIELLQIDGTDFSESYAAINYAMDTARSKRTPFLIHAKVPLLNHHTSGVRKEWYRDDLEQSSQRDPFPKLIQKLLSEGFQQEEIDELIVDTKDFIKQELLRGLQAIDPTPSDLYLHDFAATSVIEESGNRAPIENPPKVMVDCALFGIKELMTKHKECLLYGQDVGKRLGGVFREAATLAEEFGDERVFNTPIQEAFIVGSTAGMSAVGLKPIVEVQFADYIWPGLNQLFTEVSRSCYLTNGKWPVSMILRVPIGAYGSGGPYHSSSVESILTNIRGIKIAYPSNGADLKGLIKAAYYDPNPVVIFEHKGLYWSKVAGTENAKTIEPAEDYILPFGKANIVQQAQENHIKEGKSVGIITYGMGVHWALTASADFKDQVTILDLRTLYPLDDKAMQDLVISHGKVAIITEEPINNSFAQALSGKLQSLYFKHLDAPIMNIGSKNLPAIPLNQTLEKEMLPSITDIQNMLKDLIKY